jgi:hypothetical protein
MTDMNTTERKSSTLRLAVAWAIVAIPLGWGVYQSVVKSLPLFRASAPAAPASPK